jgi:hypothetical protein
LLYKPGTEETIKHSLKQTDVPGITQCTETRVPIVNSKAKEEAFLHFLYINGKILQGEKASVPSWNNSLSCFHASS